MCAKVQLVEEVVDIQIDIKHACFELYKLYVLSGGESPVRDLPIDCHDEF